MKILNLLLVISFTGMILGCNSEDERATIDDSNNIKSGVAVSNVRQTSHIPAEVKSFIDLSSNGRSAEIISKVFDVEYEQAEGIISASIVELENELENSTSSLIYNKTTGNIEYLVECVTLPSRQIQTNYFSPDGSVLLMQTLGTADEQLITYFIGEDDELVNQNVQNGRTADGWSDRFFGCLSKLANDRTFQVVALAGTIGGYGAYVAAGAVIGCGISAIDRSATLDVNHIGVGEIRDAQAFNRSQRLDNQFVITSSTNLQLSGNQILYLYE